jgi:hypothetical protein
LAHTDKIQNEICDLTSTGLNEDNWSLFKGEPGETPQKLLGDAKSSQGQFLLSYTKRAVYEWLAKCLDLLFRHAAETPITSNRAHLEGTVEELASRLAQCGCKREPAPLAVPTTQERQAPMQREAPPTRKREETEQRAPRRSAASDCSYADDADDGAREEYGGQWYETYGPPRARRTQHKRRASAWRQPQPPKESFIDDLNESRRLLFAGLSLSNSLATTMCKPHPVRSR